LERLFTACGITHKHWHSDECHDDHSGAIKHHDHPNRISNEEHSHGQLEETKKVIPEGISTNMMDEAICQNKKCQMNH
jgi:hypothetical protein